MSIVLDKVIRYLIVGYYFTARWVSKRVNCHGCFFDWGLSPEAFQTYFHTHKIFFGTVYSYIFIFCLVSLNVLSLLGSDLGGKMMLG